MLQTSKTSQQVATILFALALSVTAAVHIARAGETFTYRHGFISAIFATGAREFAHDGILALGGVPVANNPPIGPGDSYAHWPPLLPMSLSIWYRLFGASEIVAHLWMLAILITTALLVAAIGRHWLGSTAGCLAGVFWLTMPVVVHFGQVIVAESLAVPLMLAALLSFLRRRPWLVAAASFLAVCASWEPVLMAPAFWVAASATRDPAHRRGALACMIAVALALVAVFSCYAAHNPAIVADTIHTGMFRMGLTHTYSQAVIVASAERYVGFEESVERILLNFPRMLGIFGAAALVSLAVSRPPGASSILWVLGTPWLLWCILMRNHMAVHECLMQLAAPLAAIALSWMAVGLIANGIKGVGGWAIAITLSLVMVMQPWIFGTERSPEDPQQILGFASGIRVATPPGAVILSPLVSAIPLYYSQRHIVRCISDEVMMRRILPYVKSQYPSARFYWATPVYSPPWVSITEVR